jgi:DNA (cytosine-5)-methyltransferase 1
MTTRYLSICSGIEAASVAWHPLGWQPLAFAEIEAFPRAVLEHRWPGVPLHGDFTRLRDEKWIVDADVLVGGTPCQAFSVAGKRASLADDRGNLTLEFVRLADAIDDVRRLEGREPSVLVWENVPGVLSVADNAFGCFLAALVGEDEPLVPPRGKWTNAGVVVGPERQAAWRILDAQYFGVAQRRRRVFVVASARDGFDPAEVLLEWEGVRRDTPPSREAREGTAHSTGPSLTASSRGVDRTGESRGQDPVVAVAFGGNNTSGPIDVATALLAQPGSGWKGDFDSETFVTMGAVAGPLNSAVRRLTPKECERLQGFPDGYTAIPWKKKAAEECPDGPRYKALGNSMAVPVMRWIGHRVACELAKRVVS